MVDYSKWKNIEVSDDEDETHPNIDTPSLFRWRHQARIERMQELEQEKEQLKLKQQSYKARLMDVKERIANKSADAEALKKELEKIEQEGRAIDAEEMELLKKEKKMPWNIDTLSKPGFEKTVINKKESKPQEEPSEDERANRLSKFFKNNEKLCEEFGMLRKYEDSRQFLQKHPELVSDEAGSYMALWAVNLELQEKHELMGHVAHQCICLQYVLELAKTMKVDPRACVNSFFKRIQDCPADYREQFELEIESFKERVRARAETKIQEAMEEDRKARLGPGGLDPAEVFETLPKELQACFEAKDVEMLKETVSKMKPEDAKYHMKRAIDSGLWVMPADDASTSESAPNAELEPVYAGVNSDDLD